MAKNAGADAAKFQHFKASSIVSDYGFKNLSEKKSHQSGWKKSVYEIYEDASINMEWTAELKKTCEEVDIIFLLVQILVLVKALDLIMTTIVIVVLVKLIQYLDIKQDFV